MTRPLVAVVALLALPAVASAQPSTPLPPGSTAIVGPPILGGRVVTGPSIANSESALFPVETPVPPRFSVGGGSMSAPPQVYFPSGGWGGVTYPLPVTPIIVLPAPEERPASPRRQRNEDTPQRVSIQPAVSGEASATVVVQFPAAAEVWVGGKKVHGDPVAERPQAAPALIAADGSSPTEWTLTSPALKPGQTHTFEVKGRWTAGGKTFEASRSVTVTAGGRNRLIVVSGTEVR